MRELRVQVYEEVMEKAEAVEAVKDVYKRQGLKTSVILFRLLKQNQEI